MKKETAHQYILSPARRLLTVFSKQAHAGILLSFSLNKQMQESKRRNKEFK